MRGHGDDHVDHRRAAEYQRHHVIRQPPVERVDDADRAQGAQRAADVDQMEPPVLKPLRPPEARPPAPARQSRKYATPTQNSAFSGLPSCTCPLCSAGPYTPQHSAAPITNIIHIIERFPSLLLSPASIASSSSRILSGALAGI